MDRRKSMRYSHEKQEASKPYPEFGNITYSRTSGGSSYYNSLQIGMNKRFSHGLQFLASYTFSRDLANVFQSTTGPNPTPKH
jgi:hypothetical protein